MRTLIPGEWYILFTCAECKTRQILFPDLSKGRATLRAMYKVECAKCGFVGNYDSDILERYQHPPGTDPTPTYCLGFAFLLEVLFRFARLQSGLSRVRR
jgi:hypothetical protein